MHHVLQHGDPVANYEVRLHLDDERCLLRVSEVGRGLAVTFGPGVAQQHP
jgi:hypothetical protein